MTPFDRLVECVLNVSEGRKRETFDSLTSAVRAVRGVFLLDRSMDRDHHRSVLTFVGVPEGVAEAAFQATKIAAELIDLRRHQGEHPRVGATDVVPFVPMRGVSMADCVAIARSVGERIGTALRIPVFLYEQAATRSERRNLAVIRRGGLRGLAERMHKDDAWQPDFGPSQLHPTAGATVVGARFPLAAFNVNLGTQDLEIAKAIARKIRFSSGGLPGVKAIGVDLPSRGFVQVSMNLTDLETTPLQVAFDAVKKEAVRHGATVESSEIIGLVPQRAMAQTSQGSLCLKESDRTKILEVRLEELVNVEEKKPSD